MIHTPRYLYDSTLVRGELFIAIGEVDNVGCFFLEMTMYLHFTVLKFRWLPSVQTLGQHQLEGQESLFANGDE